MWCAHGEIWARVRTDAVQVGLEVGGGLLPVRLEPLDDDLLDVHGDTRRGYARARCRSGGVPTDNSRGAFFLSFSPGARDEGGGSEGYRGLARVSTASDARVCGTGDSRGTHCRSGEGREPLVQATTR